VFAKAGEMGLEKIVSKRAGSRYWSGNSRQWVKTKNPERCASAHTRSASSHWTSSASTAGAVVEPRAVALRAYWRGFGADIALPDLPMELAQCERRIRREMQFKLIGRIALRQSPQAPQLGAQRQSAPQRNAGSRFCGGLGRAGLHPLKTCSPLKGKWLARGRRFSGIIPH
jgi:hypothetical protein